MRKRLRRDEQIEFRKRFCFQSILNLFIGAESAVRRTPDSPNFLRRIYV
ncbi:hypothetical protein LEP1GSC059_1440 [Leptospira noguchii serovar Panama str. CZ214]|uniref:Uncharacterized protein n=1 Tax=Leptospira noguchii serovar Panama str. CZ214 TaxID=1001595 RepID=T0FTW9_9LEPT|nr:hypothetical protein LEP1GSC059_1440 [Leptospira noguchii serovar Panama str. CZ214]